MRRKFFVQLLIISIALKPQILFAKSYSEIWPKDKLSCAQKVLETSLDKRDYDKALAHANSCGDAALFDFVRLQRILGSNPSKLSYFELKDSYTYFRDYPGFVSVKLQFVRSIKNITELQDAYSKFANEWDRDPEIYNIIAEFLLEYDLVEEVSLGLENIIVQTWLYSNLDRSDTIDFYRKYAAYISSDNVKKKITLLLWQNEITTTKYLLKYVDLEYEQYYEIRVAFRKDSRTALSGLKNIPQEYHFDEGLFYDIVWWFQRRDLEDKIAKYLLALPERLSNPEIWYRIRVLNARYLLEKGNYDDAYAVVIDHQIPPGSVEYAELEWLAGWIALEYLHQPTVALKHFKQLADNVSYPISTSRARYWLGRSYQKLNNNLMAKGWFEKASHYSTTFYGQMALLELHDDFSIKLPELVLPRPRRIVEILTKDNIARMGLYLEDSGYNDLARTYFKRSIKNNANRESTYNVIALAEYAEDYVLANDLAKYATRFNIFTSSNYPVIDHVELGNKEKALMHALIKQESGFNAQAVSSAGAIGFMQIMPQTAREVARKLKIKYSKKRLSHDPEYNIKLGTYYINYLMSKFDGSYVLAVASYNAGPASTYKWIRRNGDPREFSDIHQVINWVEKIPFPETRNYVQRILENAVIYMHIFQD